MKVGIDLMGGDHAPQAQVDAAVMYASEYSDDQVYVYGTQEALDLIDDNIKNINKVLTTEVIEIKDDPAMSIRRKKDSSLVVGSKALANKEIDGFVSAGSTGAIVACGYFIVKRLKGVERPSLPGIFNVGNGKYAILLDVGANIDTKPEHLVVQAKMAQSYVANVYGVQSPRVKLLNIGEEAQKGTELYKEAYDLLEADSDINFTGNIEARYIFSGQADVVVVDGFTGNMVLKSVEGTAKLFGDNLKDIYKSSFLTKLAYLPIKAKMDKFKKQFDYQEIGGTPLFGVNEVLIKAHGSSNTKALFNAMRQAKTMHDIDYINKTAGSLNE